MKKIIPAQEIKECGFGCTFCMSILGNGRSTKIKCLNIIPRRYVKVNPKTLFPDNCPLEAASSND